METKLTRQVYGEVLIYAKAVPFENQDGEYYIGNCNIDVGLQEAVVRIIPPAHGGDEAEIIILNGTYKNLEFESYLGSRLDGVGSYFFGKVSMDIRAGATVWKFFPHRTADEQNVLIINKTQPKESQCEECGHISSNFCKYGDKCSSCNGIKWLIKRPTNTNEVKVFMRKRDLRDAQAAA